MCAHITQLHSKMGNLRRNQLCVCESGLRYKHCCGAYTVKRPRLSDFPLNTPFERQAADAQVAELAFRLVVNLLTDEPVVVGTATPICGGLLVTAKHVLTETGILDIHQILRKQQQPNSLPVCQDTIDAVQIIPADNETKETGRIVWSIAAAVLDNVADLALLSLANPRPSHPTRPFQWKQPIVAPFPPEVGDKVAGMATG